MRTTSTGGDMSQDTRSIADFLAGVELCSNFRSEHLESLAEQVKVERYEFGDNVFDAGDEGTGVYVLRKGTVRIFTNDDGKEISMGVRKAGDVVAELGALRTFRHESSVRASSSAELLFVSHEALAPLLAADRDAAAFVTSYVAIRAAGGVVSRLFDLKGKADKADVEALVRSVGVKRVSAGSVVLQQGATDDKRLYFVRQGSLNVVREEEGNEFALGTIGRGDVFGEQSALKRVEQPATVTAETNAVLLVVPEDTLRRVLELNPQVRGFLEQRVATTERELERQRQLAERRGRKHLLDLVSKPKAGEKVLRRFPLVEQAEESDCGAACLAMICRYYDIPLTLGKLREMANVTTEGATLDSLARVGESLGFTTRGVKCTFESLKGFDLPFIAHWEGYHYVVVYGVSKRHVWVADPARGFSRMTVADFEKGWTGTCLLFVPSAELAPGVASASPWARFARYLAPFKNVIGFILLATLVIELLAVVPPVIVQNILDRVVVHANVELLHVLMVGLVIAHLFARLTGLMRGYLTTFVTRNLDFAMISQFFKHTLSLPLAFFTSRRTGDIFARFQENMTVRNFLTESTISTVLNFLMIFVFFTVMFLYNVTLTALLIVLMIPLALLTLAITPRIKQYARESFEKSTDAESVLMETLSGAETVKAMGNERAMRMRWERRYAAALDVQFRAQRFDIKVGFVSQILSAVVTITILWVGTTMVLADELSIGQLIAFNMLMGSVMTPLMGVISLWDELHETGVAMERLGDVLDVEPEQKPEDAASRIVLPSVNGDIRFENVYFRYGGPEKPYVLEGVSFDVQAGQLVAVVGQSGSGKSTLAKLIAGFYAPNEGRILVDGYDLGQVDREVYRSQLGYVMQNNLLFSGTITENIAAGDENPDRKRVVEAARLADAHAFVSALPLGYDQLVGERGMGLSGGQVQRLCIARALYRDPRVLILDEATSALDSQTESNILHNLQGMLEGRTAVVIAHRLSTIMNADKILVLYDGTLVEEGAHADLFERGGMYHQLVRRQIAGSLSVSEA